MRIYLVGFMGCGKTSVGKRMASRLGYSFYDTDQAVEHQQGARVGDIFRNLGESAFREMERAALQATAQFDKVVVATGGGTPCWFDNMDFINRHGTSVYLKMGPAALQHRLENAVRKRPMIDGLKGEALRDFIAEKLAERESFYQRAHSVVQAESVRPSAIVSLVFGQEEDG